MQLKPHVVGTRKFNGPLSVTDPCYDKDVWCRLDGLNILPGDYTCIAYTGTFYYAFEGKRHRETRVCVLSLFRCDENFKTAVDQMDEIGEIGVDAGLAGFFENKPDYNDEEWSAFCEAIRDKDWVETDCGFCSSSGYGDGSYPVFAKKNADGLITALEIRFI